MGLQTVLIILAYVASVIYSVPINSEDYDIRIAAAQKLAEAHPVAWAEAQAAVAAAHAAGGDGRVANDRRLDLSDEEAEEWAASLRWYAEQANHDSRRLNVLRGSRSANTPEAESDVDVQQQRQLAKKANQNLLDRVARDGSLVKAGTPLTASELHVLITSKDLDINAPNEYGSPPLFVAATEGQLNTVALLLASGANIDATTDNNRRETALFAAARGSQIEVVNLLCKHGADAQIANRDGWAPLHVAAAKGELLSLHAVMEACSTTVDLNQRAHDGATAVFLAAQENRLKVVSALVDAALPGLGRGQHFKLRRADLNIVTKADSKTPLIAAAERGYTEVVSVLVNAGRDRCDLNLFTTPEKETALYAAAKRGYLATATVLTTTPGTNLDLPNALNEAPLQAAARAGVAATVKAPYPRAPEPPGPGDYPAICQVLVDNGAKEFKASQKTHELSALLTQLGVHSNGSGPYYPKAANAK